MNRTTHRLLVAAAAAASLFSFGARADESGLTRAQVRAELAEARAAGTMDRWGEAGATESVLLAREFANETQAQVILARHELEAQQLADADAGVSNMPELASYVEAGPEGPLLVLVTYDGDGVLQSADTVSLAAID